MEVTRASWWRGQATGGNVQSIKSCWKRACWTHEHTLSPIAYVLQVV